MSNLANDELAAAKWLYCMLGRSSRVDTSYAVFMAAINADLKTILEEHPDNQAATQLLRAVEEWDLSGQKARAVHVEKEERK